MLTKSTLIVAVAVATIGIASPAFAQSFSRSWGTGNVLPTYYDRDGGLHLGAAPQESNTQIAVKRSGLNAFAQTRRPTPEELNEFRQGDYYAPSKTVVQQATPQEQNAFREGGALRPLPAIWLDCSSKFGPRDECTWAW
jgi:hypothetical protein